MSFLRQLSRNGTASSSSCIHADPAESKGGRPLHSPWTGCPHTARLLGRPPNPLFFVCLIPLESLIVSKTSSTYFHGYLHLYREKRALGDTLHSEWVLLASILSVCLRPYPRWSLQGDYKWQNQPAPLDRKALQSVLSVEVTNSSRTWLEGRASVRPADASSTRDILTQAQSGGHSLQKRETPEPEQAPQ